ncbi:MAG: fused MFS/spermidine synthase [Methylococcales bacterium]
MIYLLIFLSGLSSLIYEIAWIRQASFVFGSSALAMSTVLAVFFLGLGAGSWLFGRIGSITPKPLLWCAGIELLLALNGLSTQALFDWTDSLYGEFYRHFDTHSTALLLMRTGLVCLLLIPPTLLMGGTLPLFCRQLIRDPAAISAKLSIVYGVNTLGAAMGCAATGFIFLPTLGLAMSLQVAAGLNLLVGLGFWLLNRRLPPCPTEEELATETSVTANTKQVPFLLAGSLFFMIGAAALANELIWARFLTNFIRNSVYTYTLTLVVVLIGTALGSLSINNWLSTTRKPQQLLITFSGLQALSATLILLLTHLPASAWQALEPWGMLPFILLMTPSALIAGASFPLVNQLVSHSSQQAAKQVGRMTSINILGCIVGSLLTGYVLLPQFGLEASIFITTAWTIIAAWIGILAINESKLSAWAGVCSAVAVWLLMLTFSPVRIPHDYMKPEDKLLSFAEGYNSNLAVVLRDNIKTLLIDRLWQGVEVSNYQVMVAHIPMIHNPDAKKVLVIGLGAGNTASRFLRYDIDHLHIVDIEPRLFEFTRQHFPSKWMDDPRVNLIAEDGRNYVKNTDQHYDFISVEIGQLDRPGVSVFYTREFYQQAHSKLNDNGMICQFVPLSFLRPAEFASVLKTFLSTFPNAQLWYNTDELLLIGFKGDIRQLSPEGFSKVTENPAIGADFDINYWGGSLYNLSSFPVFMGSFLASGAELGTLSGIAPASLYTDDKLQLSYSVSDFKKTDRRASDLVPQLQQHLSPIAAAVIPGSTADRALQTATNVRNFNIADITASDVLWTYAAKDDNAERRAQRASEALKINPRNIDAQNLLQRALVELEPRPQE